jgi:hypothetical protein
MLDMRIKIPAIVGALTLCFTVLPDVNQDSIYGSYFKLTGIRLTKGSDFLTVYRTADGSSMSIELFECREASK